MSEPAPEPPTELGILSSTKKGLNIAVDDPTYDGELIIFINAAINDLTRLGLGPPEGFEITGDEEKWSQFLGTELRYNAAKSYTVLTTRLKFDPPEQYFVVQAIKEQIAKDEATLNTIREYIDHLQPELPILVPTPDPFEEGEVW